MGCAAALLASSCARREPEPWATLDLVEQMALVMPGGGMRPFLLQRFEVTVADFARFAEATSYRRGSQEIVRPADLRERGDHPITRIRRDEARAYLAWLGLRLPASQEWTEAAKSHVLSTPEPGADDVAHPLFTANSRETHVEGTAPVGFFEGDRTRDGIYDLAGNVSEWTEGIVLEPGQYESYLLAEPESYRQVLLDFAELAGLPQRESIAARLDNRARIVRFVQVRGQNWNEELMQRGAALPRVRTVSLVHHRDALNVVGCRGACDAVAMIERLGREAEERPEREPRLRAWIERLPPGADGVLRRALRELGPGIPQAVARIARERLGE